MSIKSIAIRSAAIAVTGGTAVGACESGGATEQTNECESDCEFDFHDVKCNEHKKSRHPLGCPVYTSECGEYTLLIESDVGRFNPV